MVRNVVTSTLANTIRNRYASPPHPTAFAGISNLEKHYNVAPDRLAYLLSEIRSYGLHREFHKPRVRNPFYIYYIRQQIQVDLIDFISLGRKNDGYRYLICCIDCFSKYVWLRPTKTKTAKEVLGVMKEMLLEMGQKPETILCDRGTEFKNQLLMTFLQSQNIKMINPYTDNKAAIVERVNRSLQNLIYKYMTENRTERYIDALPDILETYNSRHHRTIKMSPEEGERPENAETIVGLLRQHYTDCARPKYKVKYRRGDVVRHRIGFGFSFPRGYKRQFSGELFKIVGVNRRMTIPMYSLQSMKTFAILRKKFYQEELQPYRGTDEATDEEEELTSASEDDDANNDIDYDPNSK
jgi:hypothetical protein